MADNPEFRRLLLSRNMTNEKAFRLGYKRAKKELAALKKRKKKK